MTLELFVHGFGILRSGGIIPFLPGSPFLYRPAGPVSPAPPDVHVAPWVVVLATGLILIVAGAVARALVRTQRSTVTTGPQTLVGTRGRTESPLSPSGLVRLDSEQWTATLDPGAEEIYLDQGMPVEVTGVRGVTLFVREARQNLPVARKARFGRWSIFDAGKNRRCIRCDTLRIFPRVENRAAAEDRLS